MTLTAVVQGPDLKNHCLRWTIPVHPLIQMFTLYKYLYNGEKKNYKMGKLAQFMEMTETSSPYLLKVSTKSSTNSNNQSTETSVTCGPLRWWETSAYGHCHGTSASSWGPLTSSRSVVCLVASHNRRQNTVWLHLLFVLKPRTEGVFSSSPFQRQHGEVFQSSPCRHSCKQYKIIFGFIIKLIDKRQNSGK